jgi:hypothetical protein
MAELIAIVGDSGSGKSTSIRNLDPEKTFIISTTGKRPGVKGAKKRYPDFKINRETKEMTGNFYTSSNIESIKKMMQIVNTKMPEVSVLVIDDFQYLQAFEAMARVDEKGYGKFTDMAKHAYEALKTGMDMREDLFIVIMTHSENTGDNLNPYYKIKTQGKMLDSVITLEGLFTYVLFTKVIKDDGENIEYKFVTNSDGTCTAKTPMGLFEDQLIDNDLDMVVRRIQEYNENE